MALEHALAIEAGRLRSGENIAPCFRPCLLGAAYARARVGNRLKQDGPNTELRSLGSVTTETLLMPLVDWLPSMAWSYSESIDSL